MNILIVSGSQRSCANSLLVSKYLKAHFFDEKDDLKTTILDLSQYPSLLNHYFDNLNDDELLNAKEEVLSLLYQSDGIVFVAPEWGGMLPPALVNLFLLTANGSANGLPLGNKPAFAIGVSASEGGSNVIVQLKSVTAKNSHLVWLPLHAVIRNVDQFLSAKWLPSNESRITTVQHRLQTGLESLVIVARQLQPVREQLNTLSKLNPFGQ